ncbi:MAG: tRNA-dependent cyclodipeptide synthase [Patescibacteria group bacterium]
MKYFNVTQEEIDKKLFNIFIGISLGNKLLTPELAEKYVGWIHKNTKDNALILIADDIDVVNWMIFNGLSRKEAEAKAKQKGYGIKGMFDKAIRNLARKENDPSYIANTHIVFWSDIRNKGYDHLKEILKKEYESNKKFKEQVLFFVEKYIELRKADVLDEDKDKLADYIISELPTLLGGIYWNNRLYNLVLYPTYVDSGMSQFILDIRGGKYFDSSKLLLRQLCVLVEDYLETSK